jgi:hypothetical protein
MCVERNNKIVVTVTGTLPYDRPNIWALRGTAKWTLFGPLLCSNLAFPVSGFERFVFIVQPPIQICNKIQPVCHRLDCTAPAAAAPKRVFDRTAWDLILKFITSSNSEPRDTADIPFVTGRYCKRCALPSRPVVSPQSPHLDPKEETY